MAKRDMMDCDVCQDGWERVYLILGCKAKTLRLCAKHLNKARGFMSEDGFRHMTWRLSEEVVG